MEPIINLDDPVGKTVGKRRAPNPLRIRPGDKQASEHWRKALGGTGIPKGVYRFHTHEEADEWTWKMKMKMHPRN